MSSVDDIFKHAQASGQPNKRKIEAPRDPNEVYKAAKIDSNAHGSRHSPARERDEARDGDGDADDYGPEMPPDDEEGRFFGGGITKREDEILDYLEGKDDANDAGADKIDAGWLRKTALSFEKHITKNAELRAKHEDEPQRFMASESDLDSDIKTLSILSQFPELYTELVRLGCAGSLVGLLAHENTDIAIGVMDVLDELTDDSVTADDEQWGALVDAMMEADLLDLLFSNLSRLDEKDERDREGVYHAMSILENLCSREAVAGKIGADERLLRWLVDRAQRRESEVSQNKQYAAEMVAILAQSAQENRERLVRLGAIDTVLQLAAAYRKRDPDTSGEEEEYMANLFEILTALVDRPEGKAKFVEAEGVELCLIMLKEGGASKPCALRLLNHAAAGAKGGEEVCRQLVSAGGLKPTFTMFMKSHDAEAVEHLLGIFVSMLRLLPASSAERIRTLAKFVEKDYAKLARLLSLREEYAARLSKVRPNPTFADEDEDVQRAELLSRRLEAGLLALQTIDLILAWLIAEDDGARTRTVELLGKSGLGLDTIKATILEQLGELDEEAEEEDKDTREMLATLAELLEPN
ncbi:related to nuclear associated protein [Cephalotrichum gorgonifer]|uniref:Related to nuclear associated protein n=1 Tax=Cephalotrichum gorgonifer TaxID=2041049 RepID=A0AAE8N7Y4_9PEZI|nr:related to nuclear associated protein [Cephalotrichum gorgonifer]